MISLWDPDGKFKLGQVVAIDCKWAIFRVVKNHYKIERDKGWRKDLKFMGITSNKKPCSCNCCTVGGVSHGIPKIPTTKENCEFYKNVMKLESRLKSKKKKVPRVTKSK